MFNGTSQGLTWLLSFISGPIPNTTYSKEIGATDFHFLCWMAWKRQRTEGGGSTSNKKTKNKSGEVSICIKCNKNAEEDSIECESYLKWEHRVCAGISKEEYKVLDNLSTNIMFFAVFAGPKLD